MPRIKSSISKASSYREIGEFWDTHDLGDYWDKTRPIEFEIDIQSEERDMIHNHISHEQTQDAATHSPYKGTAKEFEGDVTLQHIVRAEDSSQLELLAVWFQDGARTRPHIHDVDQVLHVVEGEGVVADENETLLVQAGDVVIVHAGKWHWHGAQPHRDMMHVSIRKQGSSTNWEVEEKNWREVYEKLGKEGK